MPTLQDRTEDVSYKPIDNQNFDSQPEYIEPRKSTADELIKKLYSIKAPEPTFDQDKADRLQRMGKINNVGRGINVLGDILGTALGAPVRRRNPDITAPALYQSYQNNLDRYKAEKDQHLQRNYQQDIANIHFGVARADRKENVDRQRAIQEADLKWKQQKLLSDNELKLLGLTQTDQRNREASRHNKVGEGIAAQNAASNKIRAEKAGTNENKPFNPVQVKTSTGELKKLPEGEWTQYYNEATATSGTTPLAKEFQEKHLKTIKAMFQTQPDVAQKEIARAYYEYKQKNEYSNNEKAALQQRRSGQGMSSTAQEDINSPSKKAQSAKITNKSYSTGGYY